MLVKTIKNELESDWLVLTAKNHDMIIQYNPDAVIIQVNELYPGSPDGNQDLQLELPVFNLLAKDFLREGDRQRKEDERHLDKRNLEEIMVKEYRVSPVSLEGRIVRKELSERIEQAKGHLTSKQKRRLQLYIEERLSLREIAKIERVHVTSIEESIQAALKKIKKFLQ